MLAYCTFASGSVAAARKEGSANGSRADGASSSIFYS